MIKRMKDLQDIHHEAIEKALSYLEREQLRDGSFPTLVLSGLGDENSSDARKDPCLFTPTLIGFAVLQIPDPRSQAIAQKVGRYLLGQRQSAGVWKFWSNEHSGASFIPADVDDTACVASFLRQLGLPHRCNDRLLHGNRDRHGRFYTWILPRWGHLVLPACWLDFSRLLRHPLRLRRWLMSGEARPYWPHVDSVPNVNLCRYFGDAPTTSRAARWIRDVVTNKQEATTDRWYQSELALFYFLLGCDEAGVRCLSGLQSLILPRLRQRLAQNTVTTINTQDAALMLSVLAAWDPETAKASGLSQHLLECQQSNGSWPAEAFFYGGYGRSLAWTSTALTTAFCTEALARVLSLQSEINGPEL